MKLSDNVKQASREIKEFFDKKKETNSQNINKEMVKEFFDEIYGEDKRTKIDKYTQEQWEEYNKNGLKMLGCSLINNSWENGVIRNKKVVETFDTFKKELQEEQVKISQINNKEDLLKKYTRVVADFLKNKSIDDLRADCIQKIQKIIDLNQKEIIDNNRNSFEIDEKEVRNCRLGYEGAIVPPIIIYMDRDKLLKPDIKEIEQGLIANMQDTLKDKTQLLKERQDEFTIRNHIKEAFRDNINNCLAVIEYAQEYKKTFDPNYTKNTKEVQETRQKLEEKANKILKDDLKLSKRINLEEFNKNPSIKDIETFKFLLKKAENTFNRAIKRGYEFDDEMMDIVRGKDFDRIFNKKYFNSCKKYFNDFVKNCEKELDKNKGLSR